MLGPHPPIDTRALLTYSHSMDLFGTQPDEQIPGQLDIYDCIEIAESEAEPPAAKRRAAVQRLVQARLKGKTDGEDQREGRS